MEPSSGALEGRIEDLVGILQVEGVHCAQREFWQQQRYATFLSQWAVLKTSLPSLAYLPSSPLRQYVPKSPATYFENPFICRRLGTWSCGGGGVVDGSSFVVHSGVGFARKGLSHFQRELHRRHRK